MGLIILIGGIAGGTVGVQVVKVLRGMGNFEFVVKMVYVLMLGGVGGAMFVESLRTLRRKQPADEAGEMTMSQPRFSVFFNKLPFKMHFKKSGLHTSAVFPFSIGAMVGFLAALMGVGGGFIMVPAMIYVIGHAHGGGHRNRPVPDRLHHRQRHPAAGHHQPHRGYRPGPDPAGRLHHLGPSSGPR